MRFFPDKLARSFEEATEVAFEEAEVAGKSSELARLFQAAINKPGLRQRAKEEMVKEIRKRYGKDAWWQGNWWLVAAPSLRFEATGLPRLDMDCQTYLVGVAEVRVPKDHRKYPVTLVGPMGKPFHLKLPLQFLRAILDQDIERFPVAARDSHSTAWRVPGIREPVRLPHGFLAELATTLQHQPVADWLEDFGPQGHNLAPLLVGTLIGLRLNPPQEMVPEDMGALLSLMEGGRLVRAKVGRKLDKVVLTWVVAATNDASKLSPELRSRFAVRTLRAYSREEFRTVVKGVLARREKVEPELAEEIAMRLDGRTHDIRDAVRVARLAPAAGVERAVALLLAG